MEATILRSEVLRQMDSGELFTLEFITADRKRGTGGELIKVENWQKKNGQAAVEGSPRKAAPQLLIKNPAHRQNKTINIFNPHNTLAHPISVHQRLIQFFNGKRVING